jgi:genome maintenance exonuclease 1
MFKHIHHELPQADRIDVNGSRFYQTSTGKRYPSVTSVTSYASRESINEWRNKVGATEADKISSRASNRGTRIHSLCEDYINNNVVFPDEFDVENWDKFKPILNDIDNVHGVEIRLFSDLLQVAGTADCIGEYKGALSVIDFKTSGKLKRKEWITNYFQQCAFYGMSFRELTGINVKQIVVLISVDDEEPQIFIEPILPWIASAKQCREDYRLSTGI